MSWPTSFGRAMLAFSRQQNSWRDYVVLVAHGCSVRLANRLLPHVEHGVPTRNPTESMFGGQVPFLLRRQQTASQAGLSTISCAGLDDCFGNDQVHVVLPPQGAVVLISPFDFIEQAENLRTDSTSHVRCAQERIYVLLK